MSIRIGTAGWSLLAEMKSELPDVGTHLQRYATRFDAVEINSSFYRPHRRQTYERWAASVPEAFRFAVKVPKTITHELRLQDCETEIETFLEEAAGLNDKLGVYLVQLPPSLAFERDTCVSFFTSVSERTKTSLVVEPRHASWFTDECDACLSKLDVSRVAADPALLPLAAEPGGSRRVRYYRLHGSPRIYYSDYSTEALQTWYRRITADTSGEPWCIFDNTAAGAAFHNAGALQRLDLD